MTQQSKFTPDELLILRKNLEKIKTICAPDSNDIKPTIKVTESKDFTPCDGVQFFDYKVPPAELKTFWEPKKYLEERGISYFKTKKHKWFYNLRHLTPELYVDDGSKKIEFLFPFWVDAEKNWKIPAFKKFIQSTLDHHDNKGGVLQKNIDALWSKDLSNAVYNKNPEENSIGKVVMDAIEELRKILLEHLVNEQYIPISKSHSFKLFSAQNPLKQPIHLQEQVKRYLKKKKNNVYLLGQQYGYIQNAVLLLHYQKARDKVRHPQEVHVRSKSPSAIYNDFLSCCPFLSSNKLTPAQEYFETDFEAIKTIHDLDDLMKILDQHADKKAKRGSKAYWDSLEKDGILDKTELTEVQNFILKCNSIAHRNPDADTALEEVANSAGLTEYLCKANEIHQARIQKWLKDKTWNTQYN